MNKSNPGRARAYAAITLAALLSLAACGGDEHADPPSTSAAISNTAPPTILAPTTTNPSTTVPVAPDTTAAAAPTTSPAPSEEDQAKQAVIEAAERTWRLYNEAILDPTSETKLAAVQETMSGRARDVATQIIESYRANHQRAVSSAIVPVSIDIDPQSVRLNEAHDLATVEFCRVGSNVLVEVAGSPDGTDLVLDDTINAYAERETYVLQAGRWVNTDGEVLRKIDGAISCNDDWS